MAKLLLVRHCTTSGQAPDAPLTDAGLRQAERLAGLLGGHDVDRIVSSPYRRAVQSIEPLAAKLGIAIEHDARLRERTLSAEPLPDWRDHLARSWDDPDYRAPGGETVREVADRGWAALDEIAAAPHRVAVVVAHGNWLAIMASRVDPSLGFAFWEGLTNPDVYVLEGGAGDWSLARLPGVDDITG